MMGGEGTEEIRIRIWDIEFWRVKGSILPTEAPGTNALEIYRVASGFLAEIFRRRVIAPKGESGNDFGLASQRGITERPSRILLISSYFLERYW